MKQLDLFLQEREMTNGTVDDLGQKRSLIRHMAWSLINFETMDISISKQLILHILGYPSLPYWIITNLSFVRT